MHDGWLQKIVEESIYSRNIRTEILVFCAIPSLKSIKLYRRCKEN